MKTFMTWDEIDKNREGKPCGADETRVYDEARYQLRNFAASHSQEIPDDILEHMYDDDNALDWVVMNVGKTLFFDPFTGDLYERW